MSTDERSEALRAWADASFQPGEGDDFAGRIRRRARKRMQNRRRATNAVAGAATLILVALTLTGVERSPLRALLPAGSEETDWSRVETELTELAGTPASQFAWGSAQDADGLLTGEETMALLASYEEDESADAVERLAGYDDELVNDVLERLKETDLLAFNGGY